MFWPALALLAAVAALLLYPLWWRTQSPLPAGQEGGEDDRELAGEKKRLLGNLRRLRLDGSEGRVAEADYRALEEEIQRQLTEVMDQLASQAETARPTAVPFRPRLHRLGSALLLLLVALPSWALFNHLQPADSGAPSSMADALSGLEKKLAAEPKNAEAWALAGRTYDALGERDRAFEAWSTVLALEPEHPEALFNLALALMQKDDQASHQAALAHLDRLAAKEPDAPQLLWYRGRALYDLGRKAEARAVWLKLQPMLPADSENARLVREALAKTGP